MFNKTRNTLSHSGVVLLISLAATTICSLPETASAWEFDTCSSTLSSEIDMSTPQAMIMLDRSGSMQSRIESPPLGNPNKFKVASGDEWPNNTKSGFTSSTTANWADPSHSSAGGNYFTANFINQSPFIEPSWGWEE